VPVPGPGGNRTDTSTPSASRVYDALLGGHDNFPADRAAARWLTEASGGALPRLCRVNRLFVTSAVTRLASDGIRQFLDLGAGLPVSGHVLPGDGRVLADVHETARTVVPDAACVYVDHDAMAASHMAARLGDTAGVAAVQADLMYPRQITADSRIWWHIHFAEPVAVLLTGVLGFAGSDAAAELIAGYARQLAPGSAIAVTTAWFPPGLADVLAEMPGASWRNHAPGDVQGWFTAAGLRVSRGSVADVAPWPMLPRRPLATPSVVGGVGVKP
jgi:S-adenosyl methyltransferase